LKFENGEQEKSVYPATAGRTRSGIAATKRFNRDEQDMQDKQIQSHHEEHEDNEGNSGNAALGCGFMHFAFGDQRFAVGSRPAGRRWQVKETIICLQGKPGQFQVPPCIPPPELLI